MYKIPVRRRACVAVDGTGLSQHAVSTYFIRRVEQHTRGKTRDRHYLKWLLVADVDRQIILAQRARQGPWCDSRALPGLLDAASRRLPIGLVLADGEFDSEAHHRHMRGTLGAHSVIPAPPRRGIPEGEIRYQMYRAFPRPLYGPRAKIETVFSVIKRKLSAKAPGRSLPVQVRQALLLGLTFNLYRLRHHRVLRGCQQSQEAGLPAGRDKFRPPLQKARGGARRQEKPEKEKEAGRRFCPPLCARPIGRVISLFATY